jgi:hypothetical protein
MPGIQEIPAKVGVDGYTMRARIQPAMLVALPIALCVVVLDPSRLLIGTVAWTVLAWAGGTALIAQLARDRGKQLESALFKKWGGKPTTRALRLRSAANQALVLRRHEVLQRLLPTVAMPTTDDETRDVIAADAVYDTFITRLRDLTRDKIRFPLVFEENANYGFRRNLWGLKLIGVLGSLAGLVVAAVSIAQRLRSNALEGLAPIAAVAVICLALLYVWIFVVSPSWVRLPAEEYAERLLESTESLQ